MDWLVTIGDFWLTTLAWLVGFAVAFGILARLMPCNPGMYWWKDLRAVGADFLYWFVVPVFLRIGRTLLLIAGLLLLFGGRDPDLLPVKGLPLWLQCVAILLIQDVLLYWIHRLFHTRLAWKFHAIHHSPRVLDWMSATRFHPINNLLAFSFVDVAVLLMGFSPEALLALAPFNIIYSAMVHANLNWTFGPLRYLFASPVFHRWHHTSPEEGGDRNFASTFPFLDLLFGTFYMPAGQLPEKFGNDEEGFPEDFWGQFIHPFRIGRGGVESVGEKTPRRPAVAAFTAVSILVVVSLLGARLYLAAQRANPNNPSASAAQAELVRPGPLQELTLQGHTAGVLGVAISADGRRIVSGSEDKTAKVWDAATGEELRTLTGHQRPVRCVAISADGQRLASGSYDKTVKVWDTATGAEQFTFNGHAGGVLSVAISADGREIVSGGGDFVAKVWNATTGTERLTLKGPPGAVLSVAVSGDGGRLASAHWESAKVWDGRTGQELLTLKGHTGLVYSIAISADGQRLVSGSMDGTVKLWNTATGQDLQTLTGHSGAVYGVAISADGRRIISGGEDRMVKVWEAAGGRELRTYTAHTDPVTSVAVSADGHRIVSGSRDGTIKVWNVSETPTGETTPGQPVR
jgi:WD40 repeat protein/sterol desaturase/sphingolipid hydroxylase (fatty acid hydroxylase superfamily)